MIIPGVRNKGGRPSHVEIRLTEHAYDLLAEAAEARNCAPGEILGIMASSLPPLRSMAREPR